MGPIHLPAGALIRQVFSFSDVRFQNIALNGRVADDSVTSQEIGLTDLLVLCLGGDHNDQESGSSLVCDVQLITKLYEGC